MTETFVTAILTRSREARPGDRVELASGLQLPGVTVAFARNEEICAEQEPAEFVFKVMAGAVRITRLLADGRRHVSAFCAPGGVFGLEGEADYRFSAEALVDSRVALVRRAEVDAAAARNTGAALQLWRIAVANLQRSQDHALLLGRATASERVCAFLRELASQGPAGGEIHLPMSRSDIADHLGLTIETVSRVVGQLKRDHIIDLPNPHSVLVCNRAALARLDLQ